MPRIRLALLLVGALGCAGKGRIETPAPAPGEQQALAAGQSGAPEVATGAIPAAPSSPTIDSTQVSELAQELKLEADSAADEVALDQLADATSEATDSAADVALPVSWDIDVVRWGEHDRVQYWLRYFQGVGRERFQVWLDRMPRYEPMIRDRLQVASMPTDLVYLALIESGYSNTAVSRSRAVGMWQFMRGTGKEYGLRIDSWVDERRDPVKATGAALRFLSDLYDRFGSYYLAAAAYNAGGGKISRGLRRIGPSDDGAEEEGEDDPGFSDADFFRLYDTRHIRRETKDYVPKLIAAALIAKEPSRYGFSRTPYQAQYPLDSIVVPGMTGLDVVARLADTTLATMRDLNPQYLRMVTPPGSPAVIRVPAGTMESVQAALQALPSSEWVSFTYHASKSGDTPAKVAQQHGVPVSSLLQANPGLRSGTALKAGHKVVVPTGGESSLLVARAVATYQDGMDGSGPVRYHKVRSGETLGGIARQYRVSVSSLKAWNGLRGTTIRTGQRLRVYGGRAAPAPKTVASRDHAKGGGGATAQPGTATVRHKVRRGETLSGIAKHYGVTVTSLRQANDLSRGLQAGATIVIPRRG